MFLTQQVKPPLALARVWYVASGKWELVARSAVTQSPLFGRFSVVDVRYKVWALLCQ